MKLRALVLAAGLGTRLRPLTKQIPKPLLPVAGRPILAWTLERLASAGCEAVAINLHHRGEAIRRHFGEEFAGMPLIYSEEEQIQGTLGALAPLREFLAPAERVLVINGDSLCRWPLKRLVRAHARSRARATLLLARHPDPLEYGGGVGIDRSGGVVSLSSADKVRGEVHRRHVFAGVHVLDTSLVGRLEEGPADFVADLYVPMLDAGAPIQTVTTRARWHDLGTPRRYLEGTLDWCRGRWPLRLLRHSWVSADAVVDRRSRMSRCSAEPQTRVEGDVHLERCVLLPGSRVGRNSVAKEVIFGPGAELPPGSWVERRVVIPQSKDFKPDPGDSLVGGMVYSPLEPDSGPAGRR